MEMPVSPAVLILAGMSAASAGSETSAGAESKALATDTAKVPWIGGDVSAAVARPVGATWDRLGWMLSPFGGRVGWWRPPLRVLLDVQLAWAAECRDCAVFDGFIAFGAGGLLQFDVAEFSRSSLIAGLGYRAEILAAQTEEPSNREVLDGHAVTLHMGYWWHVSSEERERRGVWERLGIEINFDQWYVEKWAPVLGLSLHYVLGAGD